jgi:hypothetical protein
MRTLKAIKSRETLYWVLSEHYKALAEAGSPKALLEDYAQLLRGLGAQKEPYSHHKAKRRYPNGSEPDARALDISSLLDAPLERLESAINDSETSRRALEALAVQRFSVPKGSLRQYSNKQLLTEKLRSLIHSERTHQTIGEIARMHETQDSMRAGG